MSRRGTQALHQLVRILLILLHIFVFQGVASAQGDQCEPLFVALNTEIRSLDPVKQVDLERQYRAAIDFVRITNNVEPSRGLPATLAVMLEYFKNNKGLPFFEDTYREKYKTSETKFSLQWQKRVFKQHFALERFDNATNLGLMISPSLNSVVYKVKIGDQLKAFRPLDGKQHVTALDMARTARYTLAASMLNQLLQVQTVPMAVLAVINTSKHDTLHGTLSHLIFGSPPGNLSDLRSFSNYSLLRELEAFEFLIGNKDALVYNVFIDHRSRHPYVIDHEKGFELGLVKYHRDPGVLDGNIGNKMPHAYTARFVSALRRLTPGTLRETLKNHLTPQEIESILFRREIILKDIQLQGHQGEDIILREQK